MRKFEKISFEQFSKDIEDNIELYNSYSLPKRSTSGSAGYDYQSIIDFTLSPGETINVPLGVKVLLNDGEVLLNVVRSSMGIKYNVRMCNQIGVIDKDYYNNGDNEGHIWIKLENHGDKDYIVKKGDRICQGIFVKYLTVDDEDKVNKKRTGGFGSTNRRN